MNVVDAVIIVALGVWGARGFKRGFFRESFGVLALIGAVVAALLLTPVAEIHIDQYPSIPRGTMRTGTIFTVTFVLVHSSISLLGVLWDKLAGRFLSGIIYRIAGALLGAVKGATVVAFVLLFLHLFPLPPAIDAQLMSSRIGRTLVVAATSIMRACLQHWQQPPASS